MRIVTFNNLGAGHVLEKSGVTACGRAWPGSLGEMAIVEPQGYGVSNFTRDRNLQLCGSCRRAIEARPTKADLITAEVQLGFQGAR